MPDLIPTYHLRTFARYQGLAAEVYCPPARLLGDKPPANIAVPYRSDYYKLSLCLRGTAELQVNLRRHAPHRQTVDPVLGRLRNPVRLFYQRLSHHPQCASQQTTLSA
jgi:hypothetical protein